MLPPDLRYFRPAEFRNPDMVDNDAARFLDDVRHRYGQPIFVTDDARLPSDAPPGSSASSLHYSGRAFDLHWISPAHRLSYFVECVIEVAKDLGKHYELELVNSLKDRHIHLGLQKPGVWSELIVAAD